MAEVIAYLAICFVAGVGVARGSSVLVGCCLGAAWVLGRANG